MVEQEVPWDGSTWAEAAVEMNEQMLRSIEQNVEAQTTFVETWAETIEDLSESPGDPEELIGSQAAVTSLWLETTAEQFEELMVSLSEGELTPSEARDRWLTTANRTANELMDTTAFAAATGRTIEAALGAQQAADETAQDTLSSMGFATREDILEIGDRIVELERRQHAVEQKLDRILETLEE